MNKKQNTNVTTQTEEFDRSICMSFFGNYRTSVKRIESKYGKEIAYDVQSAIIDYGLYGIKPTDEDILIFVSETVFDVIDKSQEKRARSFSGEDLEMSKKIIQSHRDRPDLSQDKLAQLLQTSKGKVNKTLQKYRNGEYEGILTFDDDNVSDNDNGNDGDYDSTDRDRDRPTVQPTETASPITESSTPTPPTPTELTEMEIYERKVKVIKLFKKQIKPKDIVFQTGYEYDFVSDTIDDYMVDYKFPEKPKKQIIPDIKDINGQYLNVTKQELFDALTDNGTKFNIDWADAELAYISMDIPPFTVKAIIKEFKQKLEVIHSTSIFERAARK